MKLIVASLHVTDLSEEMGTTQYMQNCQFLFWLIIMGIVNKTYVMPARCIEEHSV